MAPIPTPNAQHREAAVGSEPDGRYERDDGQQRQHQPQNADVVGHGQRRPGELPAPKGEQLRLDVLGDLLRHLGRDRLQPEANNLGGIGQVEEGVAALALEEDLVGLECGGAEQPPEGVGLDDRAHHRLEQRTHRHEVGGAAVDEVDHDLLAHQLAHAVVLECLDGAVRERLTVDDLGAGVEGDRSGEQKDGSDHHQDRGGDSSAPLGQPSRPA